MKNNILKLADIRKSSSPQIWGVGCSFTVGVGVDPEQTYIRLLADYLKLPLSLLAEPASSVSWAADQILRSDIRKDDIVVWGLTEFNRLPTFNNQVDHITVSDPIFPKHLLVSSYTTYIGITSVFQVINFCQKIGAKLIIGGFLLSNEIAEMLEGTPEFFLSVPHYYKSNRHEYVDFGEDNLHPGPEQHKLYFNDFVLQLSNRKYI